MNHLKYMTWMPDEFQEVLSTNSWMIDSKNFIGPNPPEWRSGASVAYFKDKLYYLGGYNGRVNVRRSNESP